jgi:hypothetical protein
MNREQWLMSCAEQLRPAFEAAGKPLPALFKVSTGFPSKRALSASHQRIGECWAPSASVDGVHQILISPIIGEGLRAADVLVHELCHAALPDGAKHGPTFLKLARLLGLDGKPTATTASAELISRLRPILAVLGPYPHAELRPVQMPKKQTTRMLKVSCGSCGYACRVTAKWLDESGAPICPACEVPMERS